MAKRSYTQKEHELLSKASRLFNRAAFIGVLIGLSLAMRWAPVSWFKKPELADRPVLDAMAADTLVIDGIHVSSGLIADDRFNIIKANCMACHSGKLISQNRATREGWKEMITWMQKTQGLWDLGENEVPILDYLSEHYAPQVAGRRSALKNIEWYELEQ